MLNESAEAETTSELLVSVGNFIIFGFKTGKLEKKVDWVMQYYIH